MNHREHREHREHNGRDVAKRFFNWLKRRPGIRHVRWTILNARCHESADNLRQAGVGLGIPNEADLQYLNRVWEGTEP